VTVPVTRRPRPLAALLVLAVVVPLLVPAPAVAQDYAADRWTSFSNLLIRRWRDRATGALNERNTADLWKRCIDDAWFLPLPGLVEDPENSPCGQLLRPRGVRQARELIHGDWRRRMSRTDAPPTKSDWNQCTALARKHEDAVLLSACGLVLRGRADRLASMPDKERFDRWLSACKKSMAVEPPPPAPKPIVVEVAAPPVIAADAGFPDAGTIDSDAGSTDTKSVDAGTPSPPPAPIDVLAPIPPEELDQARFCHRLLPTFYEVHGFKKSSEYWTPAELKNLTRRMKELAAE